MSDTCVFCGTTGTDFRPEHWVSQWISRATIAPGRGIEHHVPGRKPWVKRQVDLTVDHVCAACNHHWMSDMETRTRNIVLPLIADATPRTLNRAQQDQLASWCFMKAITLELGRPADETMTYPHHVYGGFKRFQHPPHACLIFIGFMGHTELPIRFVWSNSQGRMHDVPALGHVGGYRTAFTIGHLVVDVLGVLDTRTQPIVEEDDDRLLQIWPIQSETLDWPPAGRFKGIAANDLI